MDGLVAVACNCWGEQNFVSICRASTFFSMAIRASMTLLQDASVSDFNHVFIALKSLLLISLLLSSIFLSVSKSTPSCKAS